MEDTKERLIKNLTESYIVFKKEFLKYLCLLFSLLGMCFFIGSLDKTEINVFFTILNISHLSDISSETFIANYSKVLFFLFAFSFFMVLFLFDLLKKDSENFDYLNNIDLKNVFFKHLFDFFTLYFLIYGAIFACLSFSSLLVDFLNFILNGKSNNYYINSLLENVVDGDFFVLAILSVALLSLSPYFTFSFILLYEKNKVFNSFLEYVFMIFMISIFYFFIFAILIYYISHLYVLFFTPIYFLLILFLNFFLIRFLTSKHV